MSSPVKLYVYDLSNGLASRLSLQLTGRQINGIWHTSVVVYNKEVFYGQGIHTTNPGESHHGRPLQILDMGLTAIDEETFYDYIQEIRSIYTADKYHLLDFNCNSFTEDVVSFLTGGNIPAWIKDLPSDFLSTPFGQALRPTIDAMFRRPAPGASPSVSLPSNQPLASSLLRDVAHQATAPTNGMAATSTLTASLQICSNMQHFRSILKESRAVTAFFTSQTCPPCKIVEPVFESLADNKASRGVAFVKIDLGSMLTAEIANTFSVRVTPTFLFFLDGQKIHELKGADAGELRTQVDLLIYQAYPPHRHTLRNYPSIRSISLQPILFTQVPSLSTVQTKLLSFIDSVPDSPSFTSTDRLGSIETITKSFVPFMSTRFPSKAIKQPVLSNTEVGNWLDTTDKLFRVLPDQELFPVIDLWRLAVLDDTVSSWCSSRLANSSGESSNLMSVVLERVLSIEKAPKNLLLTTIRLFSNIFSDVTLARGVLDNERIVVSGTPVRQSLTALLVSSMLHEDVSVRIASASLAFNFAAHYHKPRVEVQQSGKRGEPMTESPMDGEWEVEVVSAIVEAIRMESSNEDALHRLVASLALFVYLSPFYDSELKPLMEVLQAKEILRSKLKGGDGGFGQGGVTKKELKSLLPDVAGLMAS